MCHSYYCWKGLGKSVLMNYKFWFLLWERQVSINFRKKEKYFWHIGFSIIKNFITVKKHCQLLGETFWKPKGNNQCVGNLLSQRENKLNQERGLEISSNILLAQTLVLAMHLRLLIISICLFPKFCLTIGRIQRSLDSFNNNGRKCYLKHLTEIPVPSISSVFAQIAAPFLAFTLRLLLL